jgi:quercetin dioxygenase-like cupin family protein
MPQDSLTHTHLGIPDSTPPESALAGPGSAIYIPANTIHHGKATKDGDVIFFTVKDASHGLHGIKAKRA